MKYLIAFTALVAATFFQSLTWPVQTGIGISLFAGLLIFTVSTASRPWKPSIQLTPAQKELLTDISKLTGTLIIFFVAAVILVAIAATGQDLSFPDALLMVVKSLPRMFDV